MHEVAVRASDLVERDDLLRRLQSELAAAAKGSGKVVFLEGESGVGKTLVVRALSAAAGARVQLLWGACDALTTPRPLGPIRDMAVDGSGRLAQLLTAGTETHEIFSALLDELRQPSLVVIEDVHWADEATLDLLRYLGRRIARTPSLLVATLRDDEVGDAHPLRAVLGDLATAATIRLRVQPISIDGVRKIAADAPIDPDWLYRVTGGNPFFVTEVLAAPGWTIPPTVRDAVLTRIARLPAGARRGLEAVSLEPGAMEPRVLRHLDIEESAISEAAAAAVLVETQGGLRFRHELARIAVADALPGPRRAALHRRILSVLESQGIDDPARRAHHATGSGDAAAELKWSAAAARAAAAAGAHREAVELYGRAVQHEALLEPTAAAELLGQFAEEQIIVDRPARAVEAWERAVALYQATGNVAGEAVAMSELARAKWTAGQANEAYELAERATSAVESLPNDERPAQPYGMRAYLAMLARRCDEAVTWARRGIERAQSRGEELPLALALNALGSARIVGFEEIGGVDDLERSAEIAERLHVPRSVTGAWSNIGSALGEVRQYDMAPAYLERAIAYARERDLDFPRHYATAWLARIRFETGHWDEAQRLLDDAIGEGISPISPIVALAVLGRLRARRGEPGAEQPLEQAWALAQRMGDLQRLWPVVAGRAELAWLSGAATDEVTTDVRAVLAEARRAQLPWAIGELSFWARRLGDAAVETSGGATAFTAHIAGDHAPAAGEWARVGCPYEEAWAMAEGRDETAMREGLAILIRLGAEPLAERVRRVMRARGMTRIPVGPRRRTQESPAGLTEREREVLALLARGLTDRDIATRLFLSPKTASHHVSAILGKLNVRRRTEAAALALSMGWLGPEDGESSR